MLRQIEIHQEWSRGIVVYKTTLVVLMYKLFGSLKGKYNEETFDGITNLCTIGCYNLIRSNNICVLSELTHWYSFDISYLLNFIVSLYLYKIQYILVQ
jgi:hypothetical protein